MNLPFDNFLQYPLVLVLRDSKQLLFVYLAIHELIDSDVFFRLTSLFTPMLYESCSLPLIIFCPLLYFPEFYYAIFKMEGMEERSMWPRCSSTIMIYFVLYPSVINPNTVFVPSKLSWFKSLKMDLANSLLEIQTDYINVTSLVNIFNDTLREHNFVSCKFPVQVLLIILNM